MVYSILLAFMKLAIRAYFRKIEVIGKENIPTLGAVVFVVNHPNALLDPLIVATIAGRQLHYLAAAEFFGNKTTSSLMRRHFNMIPVYRPEVHETDASTTDTMFQHCYETLSNGGVITIFPEGTSETKKRVRKLKTGTVRMVLGAEKLTKNQIPIIPIGLNYTNPHRFQSDVVVSIGKAFFLDKEEDEKSQVLNNTVKIENLLKRNVIHIEDEDLETTIKRVEQLFAKQLQADLQIDKKEVKRNFIMTKDVIEAVEYFDKISSIKTKTIYAEIDQYYLLISKLSIHGRLLNHLKTQIRFMDYALIILLFPVFVIGYLINILPFFVSGRIFKHKFLDSIKRVDGEHQIKPVFGGSIAFAIGTLIYFIWYVFISSMAMMLYFWWVGAILFLGAYWSGQFVLRYLATLRKIREKNTLKKTLKDYPNEFEELLDLRAKIIESLRKFTEEYQLKNQ